MAARLRKLYHSEIIPGLRKDRGYNNVYQVPRLEKIVLNMGLGEAIQNAKILDSAVAELSAITGQRPVVTKAKKAIANFKLRKGLPIGCMKKYGGYVPGIRPGQRTAEYIDRILTRLTLSGAIYVSSVCILPTLLIRQVNVPFYFGGTALLIVVGVALDTVAQMETHLLTRNYEGFMGLSFGLKLENFPQREELERRRIQKEKESA